MKKFKIDFLFIITMLIFMFSSYQKVYLKFLIILFVHETGHLFFINLFKVKINYLRLSPFGLFLDIDNYNNYFFEDVFIYLGGLLFNLLSFLILPKSFFKVNLFILVFNLFPIFPLDGYMIINTLLSYFIPYRISLQISSCISIIIIILLSFIIFYDKQFIIVMNIVFLLVINVLELKKNNIKLQRLILSKKINNNKYKKRRIKIPANYQNSFYKYHYSYIKLNNKLILQNDLINLHYKD